MSADRPLSFIFFIDDDKHGNIERTHVVAELLGPLLYSLVAFSSKPLGLDHRTKGDRVVNAVHSAALPRHLLPHRVRLFDAVLEDDFLGKLRNDKMREAWDVM